MGSWRTVIACSGALLFVTLAQANAAQRVFVSSTQSMGNLGGLAGADATCQQLADNAALGGTWVAWLSIAGVEAISRLTGNGPFVRANNSATIADDRAELISGNLFNEIDRTETGMQVPTSVWTGTDPDGSTADSGNFCNGWTDSTNGSFGQTGATQFMDANWTNANQVFCNLEARLYCFEQGQSAAPVPALSPTSLGAMAILLLLAGVWRSGGSRRFAWRGR